MTIDALRRLLTEIDTERAAERAADRRRALTPDERRAARTWAAEHGLDCPPYGALPRLVVVAWRAAQQQTEGATP
ncbi:hypothetical protein ADL35_12385 [Streptomyces sp. NRRL WC-3753]|nr:hypothetical protein ADL35_12385 [Streptomyces sp. NRRL WC-3753]